MNRARLAVTIAVAVVAVAVAGVVFYRLGVSNGKDAAQAEVQHSAEVQSIIAEALRAPTTTQSVETFTPPGMHRWDDEVWWAWTPKDEVRCPYGSCWGVTVMANLGCPSGVFVEIGIKGESGALIDKANAISPALTMRQKANLSLSPPTDPPAGAQAMVTQINCMG